MCLVVSAHSGLAYFHFGIFYIKIVYGFINVVGEIIPYPVNPIRNVFNNFIYRNVSRGKKKLNAIGNYMKFAQMQKKSKKNANNQTRFCFFFIEFPKKTP
jgi:hypothetical protein